MKLLIKIEPRCIDFSWEEVLLRQILVR